MSIKFETLVLGVLVSVKGWFCSIFFFLGIEGDGYDGNFNLAPCGDCADCDLDSLCTQFVPLCCLFSSFDLSFPGEDRDWRFDNFLDIFDLLCLTFSFIFGFAFLFS